MNTKNKEDEAAILRTYQVKGTCLYVVGAFDSGVTVLSQQNRALNFAWAAIQSKLIPSVGPGSEKPRGEPLRIAIVGCGFAGLTLAAGLIKKHAYAKITVFEKRDTLLPLQHGSDSRWLHPRIYDWPGEGSEAGVAMLPVLNWNAARASDVVVQILGEWKKILLDFDERLGESKEATDGSKASTPDLYCNCRHLQIHNFEEHSRKLQIEWVGERRSVEDGRTIEGGSLTSVGRSDAFDMAILATGFGTERDGALSYWRNETIGQPSLDQPRQTFMVSGQGDGAMIDLLRLRISQYRQDRILDELFTDRETILTAIKTLHRKQSNNSASNSLFSELEALEFNPETKEEFERVRSDLGKRLRMDTAVILHLKVRKFSELFDPAVTRISFQNKLIVYFLYKCGGFIPSSIKQDELVRQHSIEPSCVIRRHGTSRDEMLESILSPSLYKAISKQRGSGTPGAFSQPDRQCWDGGFFGVPGRIEESHNASQNTKMSWRQEYLPGATELIASAFCASVAGLLMARHPAPGRLRVTLHRTISVGGVEFLQQTCDYRGTDDARGASSTAARTFPALNGTIGLAYKCRRIVRSTSTATAEDLQGAMEKLNLNAASRSMSEKVGFVMAIPLLEPEALYTAPSPVIGVIYIDSQADGFTIINKELSYLVSMAQEFLNSCEQSRARLDSRIRNLLLNGNISDPLSRGDLPDDAKGALELVEDLRPPQSSGPFQLNYDYSDFIPVRRAPK